ncbi:Crp/Fnr family transcriptional regulator [Eubacterium sp. 1001713B170207_170306_E7]|uniref:Crp/Fnr family transcriptional regulator n=1 Tax=Eubacterium sp. 1001713B170207_170306_E7 TaxID=2787097 RepID=UPI00189767A3|nr:Crp/Fnr family transcriptional regulator [Eubacterium sp. 1001713B170207_170306_E7]
MSESITLLPFWDALTDSEKAAIHDSVFTQRYKKGTVTHQYGGNCVGLNILQTGRARIFITSPEGDEITLCRLVEGEVCILSAACMIHNLNFDIDIAYEEDTESCIIPKDVFKAISDTNPTVKDFTLGMVANNFSIIMERFNQFAFSSMRNRLSCALLEHSRLEKSKTLHLTHDALARDLGTAREVVTRLLNQFQTEGLVCLSRGEITLLDPDALALSC